MTEYDIEYDFQNIRFTDPAGKKLFKADDLDLNDDEKSRLVTFMANHRTAKPTDFTYDYDYWGDSILCTTTAYDPGELNSLTFKTCVDPAYQDHCVLWNCLPSWLRDKIKGFCGEKADMRFEWTCEVTIDYDDLLDYDLDTGDLDFF